MLQSQAGQQAGYVVILGELLSLSHWRRVQQGRGHVQ